MSDFDKALAALEASMSSMPKGASAAVSGLTGTALGYVAVASSSLVGVALAPDARFAVGVLDDILGAAGTSLKEVAGYVASEAMDIVAEIASDVAPLIASVAEVIPVVGAVVGALISIGSMIAASSDAERQALRDDCGKTSNRPVRRMGKTVDVMPSDIFTTSYPYVRAADEGSQHVFGGVYGSLLGDTLRVITNDVFPRNHPKPGVQGTLGGGDGESRRVWFDATVLYYKALVTNERKAGRYTFGDCRLTAAQVGRLGLSAKRRAIYSAVRCGIEAQSGVGDGGASLWVAYQDLLLADVDAGYLTYDLCQFVCQYSFQMGRLYATDWVNPGSCARLANSTSHSFTFGNGRNAVAGVFNSIVETRRNYLNPRVAQDVVRYKEAAEALRKVLLTMTKKVRPKIYVKPKILWSPGLVLMDPSATLSSDSVPAAINPEDRERVDREIAARRAAAAELVGGKKKSSGALPLVIGIGAVGALALAVRRK